MKVLSKKKLNEMKLLKVIISGYTMRQVGEKQIKMPVRITVTSCVVVKPRRYIPITRCHCIISKKHCCPRCEKELRIFDANDDYALLARTMQPKYCPYCGQKLWWNDETMREED